MLKGMTKGRFVGSPAKHLVRVSTFSNQIKENAHSNTKFED